MRLLAAVIAFALDLFIIVVTLVILGIAVTGGGTLHVASAAIRATSVANPVAVLVLLIAGRLALRNIQPLFLGLPRFDLRQSERVTLGVVDRVGRTCSDRGGAVRTLFALIATSVVLRAANVIIHPGFVTGDDVEIHEMTIGHLLRTGWPIWDLRSPVYPMVFIYPFQALAHAAGIADIAHLVMVGRFVVVAIATVSIWLAYRIGTTLSGRSTVGCLAAALFALSRLHLWYGSSELPRPVASVLILVAFWLLLRRSAWHAAVAGVLLACGGALRFGELVFFAPAALQLLLEHRWKHLALLVTLGAVTVITILGVADWMFWGEPFHSWRAVYQYTVVERASSRGFQPPWFYVLSAASWTTYVVLALSLYSFTLPDKRAATWAWLPIALLSILPHKEARYVIAAHPFVCVSAAVAAAHLYGRFTGRMSRPAIAATLAGAVAIALVLEAGDWQFRRTDRAVRFAQQLAFSNPTSVGAQQLWRLGGRLCFSRVPRLVELGAAPADILATIERNRLEFVLLLPGTTPSRVIDTLRTDGYTLTDPGDSGYVTLRKQGEERHQ